jgi:ketosteroid isomerase-like protein
MTEPRDPELQRLIDKQEIYDVLMRYCRAVDRLDKALLASVYSEDAWDSHGLFEGKATDFIEWVMTFQRENFENSTHSLANVYIELEGDVAFVESYFTGFHRFNREGEAFTRISCGRYIDRFERRTDGWKVVNRLVVNDWGRIDPVVEPVIALVSGFRSREDPVYTRLPGPTTKAG